MILQGVAAVDPDGKGCRQESAADVGSRLGPAHVNKGGKEYLEHRIACLPGGLALHLFLGFTDSPPPHRKRTAHTHAATRPPISAASKPGSASWSLTTTL